MPKPRIRRLRSRVPMVVAAVVVAALVASYRDSNGFEIATEDDSASTGTSPAPIDSTDVRDGNGSPDGETGCDDPDHRPTCRQALVIEVGPDEAVGTGAAEPETDDPDDPSTVSSSVASSNGGGDGSPEASGSSPSPPSAVPPAGDPDDSPTTADETTAASRSTTTVVRADRSCGIDHLRPGEHPPACWRPYGSSSPFNQPITGAEPLHPRSSRIIARTLTLGRIADSVSAPDTRRDWYHPIYFSTSNDPAFTIHCTNPDWGTCEIEGMVVHIPDAARSAAGGDGHLSVIEQHTGWEYDLWKVADKPSGGGVLRTEWGGRTRVDGEGLRSDATAAHFGLAAGVVRPEELTAGEINHALFLLVGCAAREPVFPATGKGSACADQTDAPAIGHRFRLDMTDAEIDALSIGDWKKTILRALAHYGGYVGDTGGNEAFAIGFQSASSYTSFGQPDPWRSFLGQPGVSDWNGSVHFNIADGVDWGGRLRVIDPCVAADSC